LNSDVRLPGTSPLEPVVNPTTQASSLSLLLLLLLVVGLVYLPHLFLKKCFLGNMWSQESTVYDLELFSFSSTADQLAPVIRMILVHIWILSFASLSPWTMSYSMWLCGQSFEYVAQFTWQKETLQQHGCSALRMYRRIKRVWRDKEEKYR
jgi:hypothetical protein